MPMKIPFRTRILLRWIKRRRGFHNKKPPALAFRRNGKGLSRILIIFPENENAGRTANYFLKTLFNNKTVDIVVLGKEPFLQADKMKDKVIVKRYSEQDFNWFGGLRKAAQERLFDQQFDAILDLNPQFNLQSALLTVYSQIALRVSFKSEHSYSFYNIEIDHKPEGFLELGYNYFQKLLGL